MTSAFEARAGLDHRVGDGERVDEAGAHRLHVERGAAVRRRAWLHDARRRREHHVGRRRGDDDQVDRRRGSQSAASSARRAAASGEVADGDVGRGEVARADAGALDDPLVGGLDAVAWRAARRGRRW